MSELAEVPRTGDWVVPEQRSWIQVCGLAAVSGVAYTWFHWISGIAGSEWAEAAANEMAVWAGVMNGLALAAVGLGGWRWVWRCYWISVGAGVLTAFVWVSIYDLWGLPKIFTVAVCLAAGHGLVLCSTQLLEWVAGAFQGLLRLDRIIDGHKVR